MFTITHWFTMTVYVLVPIMALGYTVIRARRGRVAPLADLLVTVVLGSFLGTVAAVLYGMLAGGRTGMGQIGLTIYFSIGVLLILRGIDAAARGMLKFLIRRRRPASILLSLLGALGRGAVLLVIGLPFVLSAGLTFRPKVVTSGDPQSLLRLSFTPVEFVTDDGIRLAAWWIPANSAQPANRRRQDTSSPQTSTKTAIVCHGLAGDKASQQVLVRLLARSGYNVLTFDFRGHGQSGGQFTSLGDLERRDVLAAVHWLKRTYPEQSKRIVGVGANIGGAAMIAAAVDASPDGQAIEAIAVYGCFDDLQSLAHGFVDRALAGPLNLGAGQTGLFFASLQTGANLRDFSPAEMVSQLWPRPIMVIHATGDRVVPFDNGRKLFDAASFPKRSVWLMHQDQDQALRDAETAESVLIFFEMARPMPMI